MPSSLVPIGRRVALGDSGPRIVCCLSLFSYERESTRKAPTFPNNLRKLCGGVISFVQVTGYNSTAVALRHIQFVTGKWYSSNIQC
jgi:hypothetical protein